MSMDQAIVLSTASAEDDGEGEPESPERWTGGMDREGPP